MVEPRNFYEDLRNSNNPKLREDWIRIFKLKFGKEIDVSWKDDKKLKKDSEQTLQLKQNKVEDILLN